MLSGLKRWIVCVCVCVCLPGWPAPSGCKEWSPVKNYHMKGFKRTPVYQIRQDNRVSSGASVRSSMVQRCTIVHLSKHSRGQCWQVAHAAGKVWGQGMRAQTMLRTASVEDRASLESELQAILIPFIDKACSDEPQVSSAIC